MIAKFKPFPACEHFGVRWRGDVPGYREVLRNAQLFVERNQTGFAIPPILEVSLKTGVRIRDFENPDRKQVMSDHNKYKQSTDKGPYRHDRGWVYEAAPRYDASC